DVAGHIRRLIFSQEMRPGDHVPQDEIAKTLGVSKLPVREALAILESEGLVTVEPNRGAFISALTREEVEDQYLMYGAVHGLAAARAAASSPPDLLPHLLD